MASNGDQNPPRLQRVFWAMAQGATASALLVAGGTDALSAVQVGLFENNCWGNRYLAFTLVMSTI